MTLNKLSKRDKKYFTYYFLFQNIGAIFASTKTIKRMKRRTDSKDSIYKVVHRPHPVVVGILTQTKEYTLVDVYVKKTLFFFWTNWDLRKGFQIMGLLKRPNLYFTTVESLNEYLTENNITLQDNYLYK